MTTDSATAAQVYLEEVTGGYLLYFMDGETKTYIRVYERTDGDAGYGKGSLELTTTAPAEVLTIDATTGTLIYSADADNSYYIGTYYSSSAGKTYENLSVSNTYYITGDNAANVGVTQFPVKLYEVAGSEGDDTTGDDTTGDDTTTGNLKTVTMASAVTATTASTDGQDVTAYTTLDSEIFTVVAHKNGNSNNISFYDGYFRIFKNSDLAKSTTLEITSTKKVVSIKVNYLYTTNEDGSVNYSNVGLNAIVDGVTTEGTEDTTVISEEFAINAYSFILQGKYKNSKILSIEITYEDSATGDDTTGDDTTGDDTTTGGDDTTTETTPTYVKVTSAEDFTSGTYVMIVSSGYAPGVVDGTWLTAVQPVVDGDTVTDTQGGVWTLTVNGSSVTIADANGVLIGPKGGNNNGLSTGSYDWAWTFADGTFTFAGTGSDTVVLASNGNTTGSNPGNHRFRGYKTTTVSGNPATYPSEFTLYKLVTE